MGLIDILLIGGGGGGGHSTLSYAEGGGGGGGYFYMLNHPISAGTYDVIVGNGGAAGIAGSNGSNGESSSFLGYAAYGGGGGGQVNQNGNDGGCGGGGGSEFSNQTYGGNQVQGFDGGSGIYSSIITGQTYTAGGGGGGIGEIGEDADIDGGDGGNGLQFPIFGTDYYGGGGGGATHRFGLPTIVGGLGGLGGGGNGRRTGYYYARNGTPNTGGGGGGGGDGGGGTDTSGSGGSGIVKLRVLTADWTYIEALSGITSVDGLYTIATFTNNGYLLLNVPTPTPTPTKSVTPSITPTNNFFYNCQFDLEHIKKLYISNLTTSGTSITYPTEYKIIPSKYNSLLCIVDWADDNSHCIIGSQELALNEVLNTGENITLVEHEIIDQRGKSYEKVLQVTLSDINFNFLSQLKTLGLTLVNGQYSMPPSIAFLIDENDTKICVGYDKPLLLSLIETDIGLDNKTRITFESVSISRARTYFGIKCEDLDGEVILIPSVTPSITPSITPTISFSRTPTPSMTPGTNGFLGASPFTITQTGIWVIPDGVTNLIVECWGGGAGAGGGAFQPCRGGGGGGGYAIRNTFPVIPGAWWPFYVGAAVGAGVDGNPTYVNDRYGNICYADGGYTNIDQYAIGIGGYQNIGEQTYNGGNGASAGNPPGARGGSGGGEGACTDQNGHDGQDCDWQIGGAGGTGCDGGNGGKGNDAGDDITAQSGSIPGGGGGGRADGVRNYAGGGARGQIVVSYTLDPPVEPYFDAQYFYSNAIFTAPAGVTQIVVECWGGGGGGGNGAYEQSGGGGGGGGYGKRNLMTVVPGNNYNVTVAAPAPGGVDGGNSSFTDQNGIQCIGYGGDGASGTYNWAYGGGGLGDIEYDGGHGGIGIDWHLAAGGGGGEAGCTTQDGHNGGDGAIVVWGIGGSGCNGGDGGTRSDGYVPGGGGAGGSGSLLVSPYTYNGFYGAGGMVRISSPQGIIYPSPSVSTSTNYSCVKCITITLDMAEYGPGPFNIYTDADSYTTPIDTNVTWQELISGYLLCNVPCTAYIIRLQSLKLCTIYRDFYILDPSPSPSFVPSHSRTPSRTPSNTRTPSTTNSRTPSITPTSTQTPSMTPTSSITPTNTQTPSMTPTNTQTPSITPTNTQTPSISPTPSITPTPSQLPVTIQYRYNATESGGGSQHLFSSSLDCNYANGQTISIADRSWITSTAGLVSLTTFNSVTRMTGDRCIIKESPGNTSIYYLKSYRWLVTVDGTPVYDNTVNVNDSITTSSNICDSLTWTGTVNPGSTVIGYWTDVISGP